MEEAPGGGVAALRVGGRERGRLVLALVALIPALASAGFDASRGVALNLFEDGTSIVGGLRIFDGQVPYQDFFAFYGPLTYVLPAGAFRLTGSVVTGITGYYAVVSCASSLVAYLLVRRISGRPVAALVAPIALVLLDATTARSLLAMAGVLALMAYERSLRKRWMVVAGACTTGALLWIQDAGAWLVVAVLVVWAGGALLPAVRRVLDARSVGLAAAGALGAALPWLLFTVVRGFTGDWIYWTYVFPNTTYTHRDATGYLSGLVRSWSGESPAALGYHVVFYLLPYLAVFGLAAANVVVAALRLRRSAPDTRPVPVGTLVLAVYGLLQLRVLLASLDEAKLADSLAPTVVCALGLALSSPALWRRPLGESRWWVAVGTALCLVWLVVWPMQKAAHVLSAPRPAQTVTATGTLGGLPLAGGSPPATSPDELMELRAAIERATTPGGRVLVLPTAPMVYAIADRTNPTRYDYLDPVYTTADVDAELAAAIDARVPEVVVVGDNTFPDGPTGPEIAPRTYAAITGSYSSAATIGHWTVYARDGS